jgi:hypothetical protein
VNLDANIQNLIYRADFQRDFARQTPDLAQRKIEFERADQIETRAAILAAVSLRQQTRA